ncbi:MAG: acyl-CoA dehydrogenase family protein [Gemmatimonadaceae bacterium]|nr:acyl-CoA dehydrogenase family protein [Gemmatimonadaceae bacterium]
MSATTQPVPATASAPADAPHLANPDENPSFIKGLFLGEIRERLVFPFPAMSAEERESLAMVLDSFRSFAAEHVDPARNDREGRFPESMREAFHALGFMGVNIPEAYGGFGASTKVFTRVFGEIGGTDPALAVYFGAHQSIGCKGIILFGTEAQKQRWLPRCATGELVAAFCLTEPGSGSDAQAMAARAVLSDDGTHYVLNGTKIWISNAGYAGLFTVFAKVPDVVDGKKKDRVTAFVVEAAGGGVRLGKLEEKMGIKASDTRAVFFENVRVPVENRLGEVGQGFRIALEVLNSGRLGLSAGSARGTRRIMNEAIAYAAQREQFGRPIASFEMIRRKIALLAADCYAAEAAVMLTASMVDQGGIDYSLETATCKVFASEMGYRATHEALQIAGGIGYSKEFPYEQAVRDSRIMLIFEGTNEILRALVALMGLQQPGERLRELGKALQDPIHRLGAIGSYLAGRARSTLDRPDFTKVHQALEDEAELVADQVYDLGRAVERSLRRHGKKIMERQYVQERLANAAMDLFLATATLSRATSELEAAGGDEAKVQNELDCARVFVHAAYRRARRNLRALRNNQDKRIDAIAQRAVERKDLAPESPTDR